KGLLLRPTPPEIQPGDEQEKTGQAEPEQEIKGGGSVAAGAGVDDGARDQGPDEGGSLADDGEEREEEEFLAAGGDFGDHDLRVRVPGADEEAVEGLVEPDFVGVVEAEGWGPDADHAPAVAREDREPG
ncbi:MAG: hypothetical protein Q9196_004643, partial [Gyalolechia fulgens]